MKKRNLFVANTYFQLITAINMSLNNLKDCVNDIVLTDISVGMEDKVDKLRDSKIFDNVFFIKYKNLNFGNKLKKYMIYLFKRNLVLGYQFNEKYDELIFYNLNILIYSLIDEIQKKNKNLICSIYDEGMGTYIFKNKDNRINHFLRSLLGRKNIDNMIKNIYLYNPYLLCYECNYNINKICELSKDDIRLKKVLNNLFDYKHIEVSQKYIFFEEAFFSDNRNINDFELVMNIANIVGKDNLIVKLHPRNKVNRFEKEGISTLENIGIPWEVIQMNEDYSNKIFLSISSGTILMAKIFFKEKIKSYYLFNCTNTMSYLVNDNFNQYLNKIEKNIGLSNLIIPSSNDEFFDQLKKEKR